MISIPLGALARAGPWLGLGVLAAGLCLAWLLLPVGSWVEALTGWIRGLGIAGVAMFALLFILAALTLAPDWPLAIVAGMVYGMWGVPIVLAAAVVAAGLAFLFARYLARDRIRHLLARRRHFAAVDRAVAEDGWKIVLLLRLSPLVPFNLQNYALGFSAIPLRHYLAATAAGIVPGSLVYVYLGALGQQSGGAGPLRWTVFALGFAATLLLAVFVTRKVKARLVDTGSGEICERAAPARKSCL
jgi:uncharacterized membrane protein YdjX (TVP38/TMEM64 family)